MKNRVVFFQRDFLFWFLGLGLLLLPVVQTADSLVMTINQVNDSAYPQVELYVSVSDQAGVPIEGLTTEDFQLFQDGRQVDDFEVAAVDDTGHGISVIVVLDTSGSMAAQSASGLSNLDMAEEAIEVLVNSLDEARDQVALIDFNSEVVLSQPFTSDFTNLTLAIEGLSAGQNTRLNDAAYEATVLATNLPPGRKAIVLLTDGQDTESRLTLDDVIDKAQESDVPIYTVGLGSAVDSQPLERLALLTGGRYLASPDGGDLEAKFATIASQLRQQYVLTFEGEVPADGRRHDLSLNVTHEGVTDEDARSFVARPRPGSVTIMALESEQEVAGSVTISPTYEMPGQVAQVELSVDGTTQETKISPPYAFLWDSSTVELGEHILGLTVRDHVGNQVESSTPVMVVPLFEAAFVSPVDNEEISEMITLEVVVNDAFYGVNRVDFTVNGEWVDTLRGAPYETIWDPADHPPGEYTVLATVYDDQGNELELGVDISLVEPVQPLPQPTVTAVPTIPASQPQQEAQTSSGGPLAEFLASPMLFVVLGIVLVGMFLILFVFVLRRRSQPAVQSSESGYYEEVADFEQRLVQVAQQNGKGEPDSQTVVETEPAETAETTTVMLPTETTEPEPEDEDDVPQIINQLPAAGGQVAEKVEEHAYFLVNHAGTSKAHLYPIEEDEIIIGRARESDIMLIDMAVSRRHAIVRRENGQYTYMDLQPTNPSFINGRAYNRPVRVEDGDEIVVGETRLVFKNPI